MEKWEYKTILGKDLGVHIFSARKTAKAMDQALNELGRQGWELVQLNFSGVAGASGIAGVLKRRRS